MRVGSLFTGIGGFDLGLERAGHEIAWQCEKDEYRRRVLKRHWPGVPCFEDVRTVACDQAVRSGVRDFNGSANTREGGRAAQRDSDVDLLCGGFPCQDLSVAGRRAGLAGERSGLFFEFARVADALLSDGGWVLIENVPGLLSSHGGRDFAVLLATLAELGFHDLAWRVLDSRYLGVPQRRRRVFILARRSRGRSASEVLLEPESGGGDFAPGAEAGQGSARSFEQGVAGTLGNRQSGGFRTTDLDNHGAYVAGTLGAGRKGGGRTTDLDNAGAYIPVGDGVSYPGRRKEDDENLVAGPVTRRIGKGINTTADDGAAVVTHTLRSEGFDASEDGTGRGTPLITQPHDQERGRGGRDGQGESSDDAGELSSPPHPDRVRAPSGVPGRVDGDVTHTLRSEGFDGSEDGTGRGTPLTAVLREAGEDVRTPAGSRTRIKGMNPAAAVCALDPKPDGPRYAACGDAVTTFVAEWIGRRLMQHQPSDDPLQPSLTGSTG